MNQICCVNPRCENPSTPEHTKFCPTCGFPLIVLRHRYQPVKSLGGGGFAKTYLAIDIDKLGEKCVIKQFVPQTQGTSAFQKAAELFLQEAQQLQHLGEHPQIPALSAYFAENNHLYLVQQFIEGENLLSELQSQGILTESKIYRLLQELLTVLMVVHSQGIIHRDIKPENIMRRGSDGKLVLIDFGASKQLRGTTTTGTSIGTFGYAPLEQMQDGRVSPASDLYSLGVTCFHLLTGVHPWQLWQENGYGWVKTWRNHAHEPVSQELGDILDKLLKKDAEQRYQSAEEILSDLNAISPVGAPQPTGDQGELKSSLGIDYTKLRDFLVQGKWKEADEETLRVMLVAVQREKQGWLTRESIDNFPSQDLVTIDRLWIKYSNERFGFSLQKRIYEDVGGNRDYNREVWKKFGEKVGWWRAGWFGLGADWLRYKDITFDLTAVKAHLPARVMLRSEELSFLFWSVGVVLFSRKKF